MPITDKERKRQRTLTLFRDSMCVACYFVDGTITRDVEWHHVFGRTGNAGDFQEVYVSQMALCPKHHSVMEPVRDINAVTQGQLHLLLLANKYPINPDFKHPDWAEPYLKKLEDLRNEYIKGLEE